MWYTGGVTCWHGSGGSPSAAFGRLCPSGGPPAMAPPGLLVSWARPGGAARPLRSLAPRPGAFLVGGRGCAGPRGVPPLRGRGRRIASLAAGTCRTTGRKRVTRGTQEGFLSFSIIAILRNNGSKGSGAVQGKDDGAGGPTPVKEEDAAMCRLCPLNRCQYFLGLL